jgi:hypothetical protein
VALLITKLAGAIERTINTLVGTVYLVVTDLTAVEALAGETSATLRLVRAVAGEVTGLFAAIKDVSTSIVIRLYD